MAPCMASRETARVEDWARVPWGSKSFSPRRGRLGWEREREARKRKSWVSSERSGAWGCSSIGEAIVELCIEERVVWPWDVDGESAFFLNLLLLT